MHQSSRSGGDYLLLLQAEKEAECYDAPEQLERRRLSSAVADEAEEEAGCSDAPEQAEKEAECPDQSPAVEAECPDSPEEEEEAEASSSEG